tara:strand:+ start:1100 stop:1789 length:690 start_codon:yes stop_codon:yes gene_type:complete
MASRIQLEGSWLELLDDVFDQNFMKDLREFLVNVKKEKTLVYPPGQEIFCAMNSITVEKTRVVIIGQDPYHGPGQAHGLAFSVRSGIPLPPSLVNILTEVSADLGVKALAKNKGDLSGWAEQGVLLLNSILTVEHGKAGSHQGRGWERFTDLVIKNLGELRESLVFMLWGNYAQKKGEFIDRDRHLVLTAPHPSPLSAHRGFFGCRHFSQANRYLMDREFAPIDWQDIR